MMRTTIFLTALFLLPSADAASQAPGGAWESKTRFDGVITSEFFGSAVASAGDVDGDGLDDLLIGARQSAPGGSMRTGSVELLSGGTGARIRLYAGANENDQFGSAVAGVGDVDGDGVPDHLIGAPYADPNQAYLAGTATLYSGATGATLYEMHGLQGDRLGTEVAGVGDLDGDGTPDFLVGAPHASPNFNTNAGIVYLYSGASGSLIHEFHGPEWGGRMGEAICSAGDVDGDGKEDLLFGAPTTRVPNGGGISAGAAYVYSGATYALLHQFNSLETGTFLGAAVSGAGDVDEDGHDDFVVTSYGADPGGLTNAGSAYLISGAAGTILRTFHGTIAQEHLGTSVCLLDDADGDGARELAFGAPDSNSGDGRIVIYRAVDGALLHEFVAAPGVGTLGEVIAALGDVDGDALPDLIAGAPESDSPFGGFEGAALVYGLDPFLSLDSDHVSYATGGPLQFELAFPASEGGLPYAIMLSVQGSGPTAVGGIQVPLTLGWLSRELWFNPIVHGHLDPSARAQRVLSLHRRTQPAAIGRSLYFAAVTLHPWLQEGRMTSIVREVVIVP